MKLAYKTFEKRSYKSFLKAACDFANEIGKDRLFTITGHGDYQFSGVTIGEPGSVTVWYWKDDNETSSLSNTDR